MVEELIAEGRTPAEVEDFLVLRLRMKRPDAALLVRTALGKPGDVVVELDTTPEIIPDDYVPAA